MCYVLQVLVVVLLEAVAALLSEGFTPQRPRMSCALLWCVLQVLVVVLLEALTACCLKLHPKRTVMSCAVPCCAVCCVLQVLVVVLLEAVSALLSEGFSPQRTLMFVFGHDEELTGTKGAGVWLTQEPYFHLCLFVQ